MLYIIPGIVKTQNILGYYTERSTPPQWHHLHVYSRLWLPPPCFINHQSSIFFLSSRHLESLSLMDLLLTDILFVIVFLYFFLFLYYYFSKVSGGNGDKHVIPSSWSPPSSCSNLDWLLCRPAAQLSSWDVPSLLFWVGPNLSWTLHLPLC